MDTHKLRLAAWVSLIAGAALGVLHLTDAYRMYSDLPTNPLPPGAGTILLTLCWYALASLLVGVGLWALFTKWAEVEDSRESKAS